MKKPIFLFARDAKKDLTFLVVQEGRSRRVFRLDSDLFRVNPQRTMPKEFAGFEKLYADSIKTFDKLCDQHKSWLGHAAGLAESAQGVHPHVF